MVYVNLPEGNDDPNVFSMTLGCFANHQAVAREKKQTTTLQKHLVQPYCNPDQSIP